MTTTMPARHKSEYLTMRLGLAEVAWMDAIHKLRVDRQVDTLAQLKAIELLAWEIERLQDRRI
ncbi:hypothetical protein LCGC14_0989520 [marine sediment metagenome]|uniref:Uncharacterized protein n=1 Tax=marine sediment metagenome TaxID=412755 RepID=A0A0F9RCU6_9ZZZZ